MHGNWIGDLVKLCNKKLSGSLLPFSMMFNGLLQVLTDFRVVLLLVFQSTHLYSTTHHLGQLVVRMIRSFVR